MKLVIVESPTKSKTIGKFLGPDYKVMACVGHISDLATTGPGGLGVDVKNDFKPTYVVQPDKVEVVKELKKAISKSDEVILATDPDREGEAIAWHLANEFKLPVESTPRWQFHEITKNAIKLASQNPGLINMSLVESQETRRIIDRIMGFRLSYLLHKKIKSRSAGRVQSVTLRFIVDRENEIRNFKPEEYWEIAGSFGLKNLEANLSSYQDKPVKITNQEQADAIEAALPKDFIVNSIVESSRSREPKPAFTTSTMQQESFNQFRYSTKKTQLIAQHLYEGKEIEGNAVGLITYMRTDANRLAPEFIAAGEGFIKEKYGASFVGHAHVTSKKSEMVQDAHEAIRPTDVNMTPERVKPYLSKDEYNVYSLIYNRAIASLMAPRIEKLVTLKLNGNGYIFSTDSVTTQFEGYSKVYGQYESKTAKAIDFSSLKEGDTIACNKISKTQHFTKAPARYTEAKIVKLMEEKGIGRPSTYSSTISTLEERGYVTVEKGVLSPTEQGELTVKKLEDFFPQFMDAKYTADMEDKLDAISEGNSSRHDLLTSFYSDFSTCMEKAEKDMEKLPDVKTGEKCPNCGADLVIRKGRYGQFVACSNYPTCKFIQKEKPEIVEGKICPKCGSPLVKRKGYGGKEFIGCSSYPKCKYIEGQEEKTKKQVVIPEDAPECPKCHKGKLISKHGRFGEFIACSNYPSCRYIQKTKKAKKEEE